MKKGFLRLIFQVLIVCYSVISVNAQGSLELEHRGSVSKNFEDCAGIHTADLDGDGDYDIVTFASNRINEDRRVEYPVILWNDGELNFTAEDLGVGATPSNFNSIVLTDINNDNAPDILVSAQIVGTDAGTLIYANDGAGSFEYAGIISTLGGGSLHIPFPFDYDNDGDADLIIINADDPQAVFYQGSIFENKGDGEFALDYTIPQCMDLFFFDFNKDGRVDIVRSFDMFSPFGMTIDNGLLINNGGAFVQKTGYDIPPVILEDLSVVDVNNDSYPDLYFRGSGGPEYVDFFLMNQNGESLIQEDVDLSPGLDVYLKDPAFAWGDVNHDNLSDLMITYRIPGDTMEIETFTQDILGNFSSDISSTNPPLIKTISWEILHRFNREWVDLNGDAKLDLAVGLRDHIDNTSGHFLVNDSPGSPAEIPVPSDLSYYRTGDGIVLQWNELEGNAWTFNLRIGSQPGGVDIVSPLSDTETGFLKVPSEGNAGYNSFYLLDSLGTGKYYWSVQAINKNRIGGEWTEEHSFVIGEVYVDFEAMDVCLGGTTEFDNTSNTEGWEIDSIRWDFGDGRASSHSNTVHQYESTGTFEVELLLYSKGKVYSSTKDVVVKPAPVADFVLEDHCVGEIGTISNLSAANGLSISRWFWDFGDDTSFDEKEPENHGYVNPGTYNLKLLAEANNGCSDSVSKVVNVLSLPEVEVEGEGRPCMDHDFQLSTRYSPTFTYQWKYGGADIPGADVSSYAPEIPGDYAVVVSSQCGEVSDSYTISEPAFNVLADGTPCKYSDYRLSVAEEAEYLYQWQLGGADIPDATMASFYPEEVGTYAVDIHTACGKYSEEYTVEFLGGLDKPEIISKGPEVWILVCSNDSASEYQWFRNDLPIQGETEPVYIPGTQTGSYLVQISDGSDCITSSDAVQIPPATAVIEMPFESLKIYPNPSSDVVTLEMDNALMGELIISIYNAQGAKVLDAMLRKETSHYNTQVDLSLQGSGVYVVKLQIGQHKAEKMIIVHE